MASVSTMPIEPRARAVTGLVPRRDLERDVEGGLWEDWRATMGERKCARSARDLAALDLVADLHFAMPANAVG